MSLDSTIRSIKRAVVDAGGEWVGVQDSLGVGTRSLPEIVFLHPVTKRAVILPFNPSSVNDDDIFESVKKLVEVEPKNSGDQYTTVKVSTLQKLSRNLGEIQAEVDALLIRRKQ